MSQMNPEESTHQPAEPTKKGTQSVTGKKQIQFFTSILHTHHLMYSHPALFSLIKCKTLISVYTDKSTS
jgi:hypothetical protein